MIIPFNISPENPFIQFFDIINSAYALLDESPKRGKGRPRKYSDQQIIACLIYQVYHAIFSFRELEWYLKQDITFQKIIGLSSVPDYSTLFLRAKHLEKSIYFGIFNMLIMLIDPSFRICAIDSTGLRSSRYDSEAGYGHGTRLGSFKGYKLNLVSSVDDKIIPMAFEVTKANRYDNQAIDLLLETKTFNPFLILADAAYDDQAWFKRAKSVEMNLLTDVNLRNSKTIESFADHNRYINGLQMESPIGRKLYKNRNKIEQLFSILKGQYYLENARLYGQRRYERHIRWVLLAYLIDEYNKKLQGINSRKYPWNR